jgi:hypothetical protein
MVEETSVDDIVEDVDALKKKAKEVVRRFLFFIGINPYSYYLGWPKFD